MKPAWWIGMAALIGAIVGYAVFKLTGWLDARVGTVIGILIGAIVCQLFASKRKSG